MRRSRTTVSHAELDRLLDRMARAQHRYHERLERLARACNASALTLELRGPEAWQRPGTGLTSSVGSIEEQLRVDLARIEPMSRDEEVRHARRFEFARLCLERARESTDADESLVQRREAELAALRAELVERNLHVVLAQTARHARPGLSRLDLIQEGSAALFRAAERFDWRRGILFRTYAAHWIAKAVMNHVYDHGRTVRVPVYLQKACKQVRAAQARIGDAASTAELAAATGLDASVIESALSSLRSTVSFDVGAGGDDDGAPGLGLVAAPELVRIEPDDAEVIADDLREALASLTPRERLVIEMRYGIDREAELSVAEVAAATQLSQALVRRLQARALGKLRTPRLRRTAAALR